MSASYATAVRDSHSAPLTATTGQSWAPPKNPLPPHRLARLANALGVSTPMPAIHTPSPLLSPSYNGSNTMDQFRRSPTPSTASTFGFSPSTSKYLLHVIPPLHLPHDSDSFDSELTPPPSNASGYHTQFRRGTLVPVHSSLQSQLGAIAKEYALPSTAGLVLYLVSQQRPAAPSPPPSEQSFAEEQDEPGPRLSEEIWRHLWNRVVKTELRDEGMSLAPPLLGLGISNGLAGRSTPYLTHDASSSYPLPLLSTPQLSPSYPFTPSPTTASSTSDIPRFNTKSAPPSSSSRSPSDGETPDTSQAASDRADSLDLPGLGSGALIPILAKVEFDIDPRKAAWYDPWLRSRRLNHAKRAERKNSINTESSADDEDDRRARPPLPFRLNLNKGGRTGSPMSLREGQAARRYLPLSESPRSMLESDSDEDDPVLRAEVPRPQNPHEVQLAAQLSPASPKDEGERKDGEGVREMMGRPHLDLDIPGMQHASSSRRAPPPTPLVLSPAPGSDSTPEGSDLEGRTILPYLKGAEPEDEGVDEEDEEEQSRLSVPRAKSMYDPDKRGGGVYDDMDLGFSADEFDANDPNDRRKSQFIMRAQLDEIEKNLQQFSPQKLKTDPDFRDAQSLPLSSPSSPHLSPPGSGKFPVYNADVFPPTPRLPSHPDIHPEAEDSDSDDLSQQAAWPAVPFTSLPDRTGNSTGERSPPQLAVNGVSATMPKRFRSNSRGASSSSESEARKRDLAEHQAAYPAMTPSIGAKSSLNSPLIPLSPDPFGRHPSQPPAPPMGGGQRQSGAYWDAPVVIPAPQQEASHQRKSSMASVSERTSRFSTDSMNGGDTASSATSVSSKQSNRSTLMSVKGIKKLWRKSNKNSVSGVSVPGAPSRPITTVHENVHSPLSPPPRPNRPSMEDMDLPDIDVPVPPRTPITGSFGNINGGPPPVRRRPSQDQLGQFTMPPRPAQERTPSQLSLPPSRRPSQDQPYAPAQGQGQVAPPPRSVPERTPSQMSGLNVPMLHSSNTAPIVAAKAGPSSRKRSMDGLLWDQESPYPTRTGPARAPSVSSSASRPTSRAPSAASMNPSPPPTPATPSLPLAEKEKNSVRKSILKWKSNTGSIGGGAVPAPLTPSASTFRSRKSSISGSPSQGAPINLPPEIPPSPKIPDQFINSYVGSHPPPRPNSQAIIRRRLSAKMASTSTDSSSSRRQSQAHRTQESMSASSSRHSHGSEETRETHESTSLDTSGFEIVSPKMGAGLSFPYHDLDHEQPLDPVRM
ncbi:hypothetical protein DFH07DRAFT_894216 [Mycena maculata]|uniref:Uncharacterized protein n=1 Tax=Mycena maculata TaxID=230809 RepID=A0AAD7I2F4_9AGAR|nr:hypothetical protein DFH07DRAFT_894216 [Mycena maculata]